MFTLVFTFLALVTYRLTWSKKKSLGDGGWPGDKIFKGLSSDSKFLLQNCQIIVTLVNVRA